MKFKLLVFATLNFLSGLAFAQTQDSLQNKNISNVSAPIPIEIFAGNKGFMFQLIASKQFTQKSRFGFFNVTSFAADYKAIKQTSEFLSQSFLTASIWKGLGLNAGFSAIGSSSTPFTVRPSAGLQYTFANQNFVVVILPRFDLVQSYNFETFAVFEYKPMFSKKWGIYTRVQGLFNYNILQGFHEISSVYLRLGASYKNIQFGLGTNHTFYGQDAFNINNFGLFVKTDLF